MSDSVRPTTLSHAISLTTQLSPTVFDFLKTREMESTKRHAITAQRDVEIAKVRGYATIMLAAINGAKESKEVLIGAISDGIKDAIAAGNTEVALELSKALASLGSLTSSISQGFVEITGHSTIEQD